MSKRKLLSALFVLTLAAQAQAQDATEHHAGVVSRGDHAMGFSHEKTTHHFRLYKDGGAIEVTANDPKDEEIRNQIQMHLAHIAKKFAAGDFNTPMFIHGTTPPGAATMAAQRDQIRYQYQDTDSGGRIRIRTSNPKVVAAVHEFLRFQIEDHVTGDKTQVVDEGAGK